jgi:hypothetical protein
MWRETIQKLTKDATFHPCVNADVIQRAEAALGVAFPEELVAVLSETNGVDGEYGLGLIWPIERIESDNAAFRKNTDFAELYMPFDHLLFFADAGNGDQFAFAIRNGVIRSADIFVWNHENDSRTWGASTLKQYLEWWLTGKLKT